MNPANIVDILTRDIKERLTLDGKNKVFEEGKELRSEFMKERAEAEAFTREFMVDKILDAFGLEKLPEKSFETPSGYRSVDYCIKGKGHMFLIEAKPLNAVLLVEILFNILLVKSTPCCLNLKAVSLIYIAVPKLITKSSLYPD